MQHGPYRRPASRAGHPLAWRGEANPGRAGPPARRRSRRTTSWSTGTITVGWAVALIVLLIVRGSLPAGARWWIWTCVDRAGDGAVRPVVRAAAQARPGRAAARRAGRDQLSRPRGTAARTPSPRPIRPGKSTMS